MRLIHVDRHGKPSLTEDRSEQIPPYAILSHTWGADEEEVTFEDMQNDAWMHKKGKVKLDFCAKQARRDGLDHFWIDTCCINKANLSELDEAIRSMFRWYRDATRCYVYLSDVPLRSKKNKKNREWRSAFRKSRWFTRS